MHQDVGVEADLGSPASPLGMAAGGIGGCIIGGLGGYVGGTVLGGTVYDWAKGTFFIPLPRVAAPVNRSTICICLEPRADFWDLGPLTTDRGSVVLLGWQLIPPAVDDGMPEEVGRVFTRALASLGNITYLRSAEMKLLEDDLDRLDQKNLARRLGGVLNRELIV